MECSVRQLSTTFLLSTFERRVPQSLTYNLRHGSLHTTLEHLIRRMKQTTSGAKKIDLSV